MHRLTNPAAVFARSRAVLVALAVCICLAAGSRAYAQQGQPAPGQIGGRLPAGGYGLVVWGGGPADQFVAVAAGRGCTVRSLWVIDRGAFVGYVPGAPALVNEAFTALFPGSVMPPTPAIAVCETPTTAVTNEAGSGH